MNKLTCILAAAGISLVAACAEDKDDEGTTNANTITVGDDGDDSGTVADDGDDDGMTATTPMEDTMSPESSGGPSDSSGGSECTAEDDCMNDAQCPGGMCIGCICVGGDDTGAGDDPYPEPNPGCPPGYGSIDPMAAGGGVCAPPCDGMACPEPTSGTAVGACALVEPGASMDACEMAGMACETAPEVCLMFADGLHCSNPPMWCFLSCMNGAVCPDGQMCGPQMICVWPE